MRPFPGGAAPDRPGPGDEDEAGTSDSRGADDARLREVRAALHRLGGELRETARTLDGVLDAVADTPDGEPGGADPGPRD